MSLFDFMYNTEIGLTGKYGINGYLKASRHTSYIFIVRGLVILLLSIIGFYFSGNYSFQPNLNENQKFYLESQKIVDPSIVIPVDKQFIEVTNYYLFIPSFVLLLIATFFCVISIGALSSISDSFICPICFKRILLKNIQDYTCPICKEKGLNYTNFVTGCPHCHETMKYYSCPHCKKPINLESPYNEKELKRRRYEVRG
jgi:hypothetical protein